MGPSPKATRTQHGSFSSHDQPHPRNNLKQKDRGHISLFISLRFSRSITLTGDRATTSPMANGDPPRVIRPYGHPFCSATIKGPQPPHTSQVPTSNSQPTKPFRLRDWRERAMADVIGVVPSESPATAAGDVAGGGAGGMKKNRIQVSNRKKPLFFYVNLAKVPIPIPSLVSGFLSLVWIELVLIWFALLVLLLLLIVVVFDLIWFVVAWVCLRYVGTNLVELGISEECCCWACSILIWFVVLSLMSCDSTVLVCFFMLMSLLLCCCLSSIWFGSIFGGIGKIYVHSLSS